MMSTIGQDKSRPFAILTILCFGVSKAVSTVTYTAYHSSQTWDVAKQHCEDPRNSFFARIHNFKDIQNARKRFIQRQIPQEYWVGIKYVVNQNDFIWADGSALYSNNDFENIVNRSFLRTQFSSHDQCMYITADKDVLLPSECPVLRKYLCQDGQDNAVNEGVIAKPSSELQPSTSSPSATSLSLPISSPLVAQSLSLSSQPLLSASPMTLVPPMTSASPPSKPLAINSLSKLSPIPQHTANTIALTEHSSVYDPTVPKIIGTPSGSSSSSPTVIDFERLIQDHENKLGELNVSDASSLEQAMNLTSKLLKDVNEVDTANGMETNLLVSGRVLEEFALRYANYHMTSKNDSETIVSIGRDEIAMSVMRIPADNRNDVLFPRVTAAFDQTFILEEEKAIKLPAELFTGQERYAACILYNNATKMIPNEASSKVDRRTTCKSRIVACTLSPTLTGVLTENVTIKLRKFQEEGSYVTPNCVYWDFSHRIKDGGSWSTDGCSLVQSSKEYTSCSCNHLTNFAVLMEVGKTEISDENRLALEIITYIGCALSLAGESVTILAYLILMNLTSVQTQIRLNMVICLAVAQLVFIAGIEGATWNEVLCISVAIVINYFYLVAFAWMVMEGIMLYLMLIKVFNVNAKMNYFYGFSWGFPALVVVIALSINVILTGGMEGAVRQDVCWFSFSSGLVWSFVGPVLLACLTNLIVLVRIVVEMMKLNDVSHPSDGYSLRHSIKACLVLCPLLGLSWIFGVFVATETGLIFQYLFAILNSLQGFFIFIFHVARSKELKAALLSKKHKWNASRSISISNEKRLGATGSACSGKGNELFSPRNRITPNTAIDQINLPRII